MDSKDYTILVAESDEAFRALCQEELEREGYHVVTAENALHVQGVLEDQPIHLLITDVKMSDINAMDLIPMVRKESPHLPILIVSADKKMEREFTFKGIKIDGFFPKPVDFEALKARIQELLTPPPSKTAAP